MKVDKTKWEYTTLNACLLSLRTGLNPRNNFKLNEEGADNNYITVRELNGRGITITEKTDKFCDYAFPLINHRSNLEIGDVLFSGTGSIGRTALVSEKPKKWNIKEGVYVLKPNGHLLDSIFLLYYLHSEHLLEFCKSNSKGATIQSIPMAKLQLAPIYLPPLTEQRAIAAELDAVQKMIEGYKAQLADLDTLAQSIFLDMFGDPITNPKGWSKEILKNNAIIGTGATPSRKNPNFYNGNIPWVKSTEVRNCSISFTEEHINQDAIEHSNCSIYPIDTIILAMYGQGKTRGQVALLKIQAATNQACAAIQCKKQLNPIFTFWFFQLTYQANRKLGNGTNQKNMNLSIVGAIPLILPPLPLQQQFAERVEAIERQKELLQAQLAEAQTLMAERMQYYFD